MMRFNSILNIFSFSRKALSKCVKQFRDLTGENCYYLCKYLKITSTGFKMNSGYFEDFSQGIQTQHTLTIVHKCHTYFCRMLHNIQRC